MKLITVRSGPASGKSYLIPDDADTFELPPGDRYRVKGDSAQLILLVKAKKRGTRRRSTSTPSA